jgi:hypothetical protein
VSEDILVSKESRGDFLIFASSEFQHFGNFTMFGGKVFGTDRKQGESPFDNGSDEAFGVGGLLAIAADIVKSFHLLIESGRNYSAAALLRQLVEVEYLIWAFANNHKDGAKWLRADKKTRSTEFKPKGIRDLSNGRFPDADYGLHCEFGGHPTPKGFEILGDDPKKADILFLDLAGHSKHILEQFERWTKNQKLYEKIYLPRLSETQKAIDNFCRLFEQPRSRLSRLE